jgi:hypothetical protein
MSNRLAGRIKTQGNMNTEEYFKNWPNKCPYNDDINWACSISIQYLTKIAPMYKKGSGKIGLVIFDLDDTIFFGDPANVVGVTEMSLGLQQGPKCKECVANRTDCNKCKPQEVFILPPNKQVVKVANTARELGFKIVMLTARPIESQLASVSNLNMFNIPHDMLIMNDKDEDPFFKIRVRRKLQLPNQDIVLTCGDQFTDIYLPGPKTCAIKLPDPDSLCAYAYVP